MEAYSAMADQEIVKLLEEIRDLQKLHVENYKNALTNQQESINLQKSAVRRSRISLLILVFFLIVMVVLTFWPALFGR
jgi:hypothetical protein